METFVVNELCKQIGWCDERVELYHYRDRRGGEVDIVIETASGKVYGIEVKAAATVTGSHFRSLKMLQTHVGEAFQHGIVFYAGEHALSFGPHHSALPISFIWQ